MQPGEHVAEDYAALRFSLKAHPVSFLRAGLAAEGVVESARLPDLRNGGRVAVAGLVLVRQRPGTAKGVIFATLEDETGVVNVIVWPKTFARYRKTVLQASLLRVEGTLQREGLVIHVIARRLIDLTARLDALRAPDRGGVPLTGALAHADEVKRPNDRLDPRDLLAARRLYPSRNFH